MKQTKIPRQEQIDTLIELKGFLIGRTKDRFSMYVRTVEQTIDELKDKQNELR